MFINQTINGKNSGFTLVEVMVVILIISILVALGNYGDFTQRREKARMEELAVQLTTFMDQEKTNTLLGKTENESIVRKRKIQISTTPDGDGINILTFTSYVDLAEDTEDKYCGRPGNAENCFPPSTPDNVPLTTKSWQFFDPTLVMKVYNCDAAAIEITPTPGVTIIFQGDTATFSGSLNPTIKHLVVFLSRGTYYREIHIDRRTGVIYERESINPQPTCT